MNKKTKIIVLFTMLLCIMQPAFASGAYMIAIDKTFVGICFEVAICSVVLYFCFKGVKSCFKNSGYSRFYASYHSEKIGYDDFYVSDKKLFNIESVKRVKKLMESNKKTGFKKNSTINQHLKAESECVVAKK